MPSGGSRPGAGRPKGRRSSGTIELEKWMALVAGSLEQKLTAVAEDENVPQRVRLESLRRLFGMFAARTVARSAPNKETGVAA